MPGDEDQFFDPADDVSTVFSSCPSSPEADFLDCVSELARDRLWVRNLDSVRERRDEFMRWMGWSAANTPKAAAEPEITAAADPETSSSASCCSEDESFEHGIKNLDDEFAQDAQLGENRSITIDESMFAQSLMRRDESTSSSGSDSSAKRKTMGWLRKLGAVACIVDREGDEVDSFLTNPKIRRVKVRSCKKKSKEFSALFARQDIHAHEGAILAMKFSHDGRYLATGGEDGVVRVWRVMECHRTDDADLPEDDPSCIYFMVNRNSELEPLYADTEKKIKTGNLIGNSDSACVVVPSGVFRIHEKPTHEYHGHHGDVLDLSWSKDGYILSSSVDKFVHLWRVGCDSCIKSFSHSNYVTSVQFNPVDENYFISGSIDGKVRLWDIPRRRVVDWIGIKDIVTAVCYRPDGKSCVVGTITGDCRFYDASDNHLQLDAQISLHGKKNSCDKRITGLQFCPSDKRKVMVTSADSQVRILEGNNVVGRYRGLRNTGSQISASFTSDGRHIISASEDSNVYVWSHINRDAHKSRNVKTTWSSERFTSSNVSVAIPWNGFQPKGPVSVSSELVSVQQEASREQNCNPENDLHHSSDSLNSSNLYLSPAGSFMLSPDLFSDALPKGSGTWPEEKLPSSSIVASALYKSQYKLLKSSFQNTSSAWGQVIVTAGWDGRIKTFRNYGLPVNM